MQDSDAGKYIHVDPPSQARAHPDCPSTVRLGHSLALPEIVRVRSTQRRRQSRIPLQTTCALHLPSQVHLAGVCSETARGVATSRPIVGHSTSASGHV